MSEENRHMDSTQTLHDFVLNLLTNPDARSAFDLDPEGALNAAGLSDVTATDVQDVVPLVVDYVPVQGITSMLPVGEQLGLDGLVTHPTDAIGQLQSVAQQITISTHAATVDVNAATLGAISLDPTGLAGSATILPGIGLGLTQSGLTTDLSGVHDVSHTLDSDIVGQVGGTADPVVSDVTGVVGTADGLVGGTTSDGLLGTADLTANTLTSTLGHAGGLTDGLGVGDTLGGLGDSGSPLGHLPALDGIGGSSPVGGVTHQVDGALHGVTDTVGGVTSGVHGGVSGDIGVHGEAHASADGGLLDLTHGLL
jgi:hypothetical protein